MGKGVTMSVVLRGLKIDMADTDAKNKRLVLELELPDGVRLDEVAKLLEMKYHTVDLFLYEQ
jgi:hypothetical protein